MLYLLLVGWLGRFGRAVAPGAVALVPSSSPRLPRLLHRWILPPSRNTAPVGCVEVCQCFVQWELSPLGRVRSQGVGLRFSSGVARADCPPFREAPFLGGSSVELLRLALDLGGCHHCCCFHLGLLVRTSHHFQRQQFLKPSGPAGHVSHIDNSWVLTLNPIYKDGRMLVG